MYACIINRMYDVAFVLYNGESLAELLKRYANVLKVITFGSYDDCQICADAYNED